MFSLKNLARKWLMLMRVVQYGISIQNSYKIQILRNLVRSSHPLQLSYHFEYGDDTAMLWANFLNNWMIEK